MILLRSIKKIGEENMKKLIIIVLLVIGINAGIGFIKEQMNMHELQQINMLEVERCTEAMRLNPDLICD